MSVQKPIRFFYLSAVFSVFSVFLWAGLSSSHLLADGAGKPNAVMQLAARTLQAAEVLDADARSDISNANKVRKEVGRLRRLQNEADDELVAESLQEAADALATQLELWQTRGGAIRETGAELRRTALSLFIEGFNTKWKDWVNNSAPLVMDAVEYEVMGHNNQVRSVHPNLDSLHPKMGDMPDKHQGMSIKVPALTGQKPPESLNVSSYQIGRDRKVLAHIEVASSEENDGKSVPLNSIHKWRLLVSDLNGEPIANAKIEVVGHMPGHVHGLPTQPEVTGEVAPGVYQVEGVKFQMNGWWVIEFNIEHGDVTDNVLFNLVL